MLEYTCYEELKALGKGVIPAVHGNELETDQVAIGATSAASDEFPNQTRYIVVHASADCRIAIGEEPVASNSGTLTRKIYTGREYVFRVTGVDKIAVIELEA